MRANKMQRMQKKLFKPIRNASPKPLAILENGIDAYDDENGGEYENIGLPYQALYARTLWREILKIPIS
jgi:hypothetical protein